MVDETGFISIEHGVQTQREKLRLVSSLDCLFSVLIHQSFVHVEQIRKPIRVVESASHISLLFGDHLAHIFHQESTSWDLLHSEQSPHENARSFLVIILYLRFVFVFRVDSLADSFYQKFIPASVLRFHEEVLA
jgi:hypothetical protein